MFESVLDTMIGRGAVTLKAISGLPYNRDLIIAYLYATDILRRDELAAYFKITTKTVYRKFIYKRKTDTDFILDHMADIQGISLRRRIGPYDVFKDKTEYIAFLEWRDSQTKGDDIHDIGAAAMLAVSRRRIQQLKKEGVLIGGDRRGTTMLASLEIYQRFEKM